MARLLRMPEVAANATEAVLADWSVPENTAFAAQDSLATVETEKALVDVEADQPGVVLKALVGPGSQVEVGAPIAVLGDPGERVADLDALLAELGVADIPAPKVAERRDVPDPEGGTASTHPSAPSVEQSGRVEPVPPVGRANGSRVFASPLARKLAKAAGIPVEEIVGTGPRQRILRRDAERVQAARAVAPAPAAAASTSPGAAYEDLPHSRVRRATAARLTESVQTAPHFYVRATVRVDRLVEVRAELNGEEGVAVSLNDLVVKAAAAAHRRVPEMNVVWTEEAVRSFREVDIAVAVATDRGLLTPVVRDVGNLSVTALAARTKDLAERARAGRLRQEELEGGTMSVTNLGMFGTEEFAAIINPPHASILAVGAVREEPVVKDGALVVGRVMRVTLSVDHRPVDGVVAARWMRAFIELVEHPARILA
jgi:pyruvate dehydrogenase E2 component (dihydrolipoamide acetyltransferase)